MAKTWTKQQLEAIEAKDGTVLVSAAAGSGKTSVLIERILRLITDPRDPADIDRFLIVTFTKAAANEIRSRLFRALEEKLNENPADRHLLRQQILLSQASIGTIDSFCARLLREFSRQVGISAQFRVGEGAPLELLKAETAEQVIEQAYQESDPAFLQLCDLLSGDRNDRPLRDALLRLYDFIQAHPFPLRWLESQRQMFEDKRPLGETAWGHILLQKADELLEAALIALEQALALCDQNERLWDAYRPALEQTKASVCAARECFGDWDTCKKAIDEVEFTRFGTLRRFDDPALKEQVTALRDQAKTLVNAAQKTLFCSEEQANGDREACAPVCRALVDLTRRFDSAFSAAKDEKNWLDFNDLEHRLLTLLAVPDKSGFSRTEIARQISERYRYILVDEYQDTNATQDTLFSALSDNENNLFIVGDSKQSIYGFRQAMPEIFQNRLRMGGKYDGKHFPACVALAQNFRSRKQIVSTVNTLFSRLMREELSGIDYDKSEALFSSRSFPDEDNPRYNTEILLLEKEGDNALDAAKREARMIGNRILSMISEGFSVTEGDSLRPAVYGDFCVLLRSTSQKAPVYTREWQQMGIPVDGDGGGDLLQCAEIQTILSILRTVDNPLLDIPLLAAMMSPVYGFIPDEMAVIREYSPQTALYPAVKRYARLSLPLSRKCRDFLSVMDHYRLLACVLPVDQLIRRIFDDTGLLTIMGAKSGGTVRMANLRRFYDYAREFEQDDCKGLGVFIAHLDKLQDQGIGLPGAVNAADQNAVHLMTIHRSKGLEFPIVFVAGLGNDFNRRSSVGPLLLHTEAGIGLVRRDRSAGTQAETVHRMAVSAAVTRSDMAEELRVLYVALTRAKDKLLLTAVIPDISRLVSRLETWVDGEGCLPCANILRAGSMIEWVLSALLRNPGIEALRDPPSLRDNAAATSDGAIAITRCTDRKDAAPVHREPELDIPVPEDFWQRLHFRYRYAELSSVPMKISASQVDRTEEISKGALARPALTYKSHLTPAQRGTAVHLFLQFADLRSPLSSAQEVKRLCEQGILSNIQQASLPFSALDIFRKSDICLRMMQSPKQWREYPFSVIRPVTLFVDADKIPADALEDSVVVQGIADAVFEENGALVIVDYKTDRVKTPDELLTRYQTQLNIYASALAEIFRMPVKECVLYSFALHCSVPVPLPETGFSESAFENSSPAF